MNLEKMQISNFQSLNSREIRFKKCDLYSITLNDFYHNHVKRIKSAIMEA